MKIIEEESSIKSIARFFDIVKLYLAKLIR